jgi:hypothetical protein
MRKEVKSMFPTFHFNVERWKYNPTFELYVSTKGRIRNKSKADIAPKVTQSGYLSVYVYGSLNKYMLLHRVVMLTWRPTPEAEELTVDHKNHNKRDNSLDNLEWVSHEENLRRANEDYLVGSTLVGNDIIISAPKQHLNRGRDFTIDYFYITRKYSTDRPFTIRKDLSDLEAKVAPWVGRIHQFTVEGFRQECEKMLNGVNTAGAKKWCGITIRAVYKDGKFQNNEGCPMKAD